MTDKIWKFFTSLRLTVVLLAFCVLLVFLGTIAQVQEGLWNAQERWFKELLIIRQKGDPWWVPPIFPGGYLLGVMLLLNLIAAHLKRFDLTWKKLGINLTHFGVILLLVGQLATDMFSRESVLSFSEGETKQFSESHRAFELAFVRSSDAEKDQVVSIPQEMLKDGAEIRNDALPFTVRVKNFWINSEPAFRAPTQQNAPPLTDRGLAQDFDFKQSVEVKGMDQRNLPTAIVELVDKDGKTLGTWVASSWADDESAREGVKSAYTRSVGADVAGSIMTKLTTPQTIEAGGAAWRIALRPERFYKDFSVTLLKTTHEVYRGTEIPKDFRSRVRIENVAKGEKREVEIYMNNPLRYEGLTFYQSTMGRDDVRQLGRSGLQVVRNPSWLTPYFGCIVVGIGMMVQFGYHLVSFITKRRSIAAA
jgi:hypothetical protein